MISASVGAGFPVNGEDVKHSELRLRQYTLDRDDYIWEA